MIAQSLTKSQNLIFLFNQTILIFLLDNVLSIFTSSLFLEWYGLALIQLNELDKTQNFNIAQKKTISYNFGNVIAQSSIIFFTDYFVNNWNICRMISKQLKLNFFLQDYYHYSSLKKCYDCKIINNTWISLQKLKFKNALEIVEQLNGIILPVHQKKIIELSQAYDIQIKIF
ncbi:unnamed protein product [Paramecium sonneborni]|uniref:Transmembrane protein n=1 Tax=Paramecium sonneborni TaxID=65129 RepID=A0A8S1R425_9CILI|nr:unnamed protein product [Paramecium sonneborni]